MTLLRRSLSTNRSKPRTSPCPSDVPGAGTVPGSSVSRNRPIASASSVNGTSGYASPSKASKANRSPSSRATSDASAERATNRRLGATSSVAIDPEVSTARTTSTPSRSIFSRTIPHCGRARASTVPSTPTTTNPTRIARQESASRRTTRGQRARATRCATRSESRRAATQPKRAVSGTRHRAHSHPLEANTISTPEPRADQGSTAGPRTRTTQPLP